MHAQSEWYDRLPEEFRTELAPLVKRVEERHIQMHGKPMPPCEPFSREGFLSLLGRWERVRARLAQAAPGQPIPSDKEPDDPKDT